MKTFGVKELVNEALEGLPKPHTEDAIDDVFVSIEADSTLRARYDKLVAELGKNVVNTWGASGSLISKGVMASTNNAARAASSSRTRN